MKESYIEVKFQNRDNFMDEMVNGKPITFDKEIIGVMTSADPEYIYGKIKEKYIETLTSIISIEPVIDTENNKKISELLTDDDLHDLLEECYR